MSFCTEIKYRALPNMKQGERIMKDNVKLGTDRYEKFMKMGRTRLCCYKSFYVRLAVKKINETS
jgi:hypothetical protein